MSSTFPSILPVLPVWVGMRRVPPQIRNTLCTNHIKQQLPTKHWPRRELERGTSRNPFIFYGPFGDSFVISSSILKRGLTPPLPLRRPNLWLDSVRGNSDTRFVTHWGKSRCTTYSILFSFGKYLHSHAIFQLLVNCFCHVYSFGLCQTYLQHTKAHWATRLPTQQDMVHQVPWVNELAPALCKMSLQTHAARMRRVLQQKYSNIALVHQCGITGNFCYRWEQEILVNPQPSAPRYL